jgi:hypothetical protein
MREILLERQWAAINELDSKMHEVLANTTIKQAEDLAMRVRAMDEWERAVDELEQKLQEREGQDNLKLNHELEALATRESSLDSHKAT